MVATSAYHLPRCLILLRITQYLETMRADQRAGWRLPMEARYHWRLREVPALPYRRDACAFLLRPVRTVLTANHNLLPVAVAKVRSDHWDSREARQVTDNLRNPIGVHLRSQPYRQASKLGFGKNSPKTDAPSRPEPVVPVQDCDRAKPLH